MGRRSIMWPPVLEGGRLEMTPDPDLATGEDLDVELSQIIALSLLPFSSTNPWHSGLGMRDGTWDAQNRTTQGAVRAAIKERFRKLEAEKRARLLDVTFTDKPGERSVVVEYLSLETSRKARTERPIG